MDYETLRMISSAVNTIATFFIIAPLIRRSRAHWPWVTLTIVCVGYLNYITYAAAPSPEKAWWAAAALTALVLVGGIGMGILQRKYFESRTKAPEVQGSEKGEGIVK
jgi:F0F1-type ATP synthase membrane subunit c/vacuolar-type H+-ATPase subunit K